MRAGGCSRVLKEVLLMLMMLAGWRSKSHDAGRLALKIAAVLWEVG